MEAKLYVISTPLGNRGDITLRALESLRTLEYFFTEDSREFRKLLELYEISAQGKKVFSYAAHNMKEATEQAIGILQAGEAVGLVSDRGTPGISDPGNLLVARAFEAGFGVCPIPGASSVTALMSVCPFPFRDFSFVGFLPTKAGEREKLWTQMRESGDGYIFLESPQRIRKTLEELAKAFPEGKVFYGREMTKLHEEFRVMSLKQLELSAVQERGEFTCFVVPGKPLPSEGVGWNRDVELRSMTERDWAKAIAERHEVSASTIYNALQRRKGQ